MVWLNPTRVTKTSGRCKQVLTSNIGGEKAEQNGAEGGVILATTAIDLARGG